MKITKLFNDFFHSEKAGGLVLLFVAVISISVANSSLGGEYTNFWNITIGSHSLVHWINDGLMTIFFLLIGLELEREIYQGELSNLKSASLPIFGAVGGMILPAAIFLLFNYGTKTQPGAGIPMATDIAFAIGILSLLGNRVPPSLKVFLTALAIMDDLGAIIIIATFYTTTLSIPSLGLAMAVFVVLLILNRMKIRNLIPYIVGGIIMWYFMLSSGVHATITGILLAFAIPFGNGDEKSTSFILQRSLHKPVAFFILPVFALANTCIDIGSDLFSGLTGANSVGIICGLVIGKPLGIFLFCFTAVMFGFSALPAKLKWTNIVGAGFLGGIGFTMSIFITILAYDNLETINISKIAIVLGSCIAGCIGFFILRLTLPGSRQEALPIGR